MTGAPDTPSAASRLLGWDLGQGVPPAEMIAEYNEDMWPQAGWATIDGDLDFGSYHRPGDYTVSCYLLAEGPHPTHEHVRGRHLPSFCAHRFGPDRVCGLPPDHPIHRPDCHIEIWEWPDIIERYAWTFALYLLAGGR